MRRESVREKERFSDSDEGKDEERCVEEKVLDGRVRIMGLPVRKFKFKYL